MRNKIFTAVIIIAIIVTVGVFVSRVDTTLPSENEEEVSSIEESVILAEEWMRSFSPTYVFDGYDLEFIYGVEVSEGVYELLFEFTSSTAGYGDRSNEMVAQVITPHTTVVTIENSEVVSVITDELFSEKDNEMIGEETILLDVYFVLIEDGSESISAVKRSVPFTEAVGYAALSELLKGPSVEEKEKGYSTAINEGVEILSLEVGNGTAYVDFSSEMNVSGGSALVMAIRDQVIKTLSQFETVETVFISIEGNTEDILQP